MTDVLHALRRAISAGRAEFARAMWQARRRKALMRNNEGF